MKDQGALGRLDSLIQRGEAVMQTAQPNAPNMIGFPVWVEIGLFSEWRNQAVDFLTRTVGASDGYVTSFIERCKESHGTDCAHGLGILRAVREDVKCGYLATLREVVHADVFSDFLEMAEYLMSEDYGYKEAAAVLAGGVLEEHLRKLCQRHGVPTVVPSASGERPKKADMMNADLAKADVYNKNQQKIVTGWLAIRNSAAHNRHDEYKPEQVASLITDVRHFIAFYPA